MNLGSLFTPAKNDVPVDVVAGVIHAGAAWFAWTHGWKKLGLFLGVGAALEAVALARDVGAPMGRYGAEDPYAATGGTGTGVDADLQDAMNKLVAGDVTGAGDTLAHPPADSKKQALLVAGLLLGGVAIYAGSRPSRRRRSRR